MSGFDEIARRFRPVAHDTWGKIGSLHKAPQFAAEPVLAHDPEEGGPCIKTGCAGRYKLGYSDDGCCSCHINPPCGYCTSSYFVCSSCDLQPDEVEP